MTTFNILLDQHKGLKALMENIESLYRKDPNDVEPVNQEFQKFKKLFSLHDDLEEKVLYKHLLKNKKLQEVVLKAEQAHHAAKMILLELRLLSFATEEWLPKFLVLKDNISLHIKEEEEILFKTAEQVINLSGLTELKNEMEKFVRNA